ncbi:FAD-dependent oxidoreductase [Candidatus Saccharibacteria bacterium]|nr:FAD-dependent oxidoreductase [Candidatus Saccharibacteria bacterium]
MKKHFGRIVIVGGGFAGVKLALSLAKHRHFDVCLISDTDFFEYHAALYRSATGGSPKEVKIPLGEIFASYLAVKVVKDKIVEIDYSDKKIIGRSGHKYYFDKLVMAPGQVACFYGIAGMEESAFALDSIGNADKLRKHLERLVQSKSEENKLEFVVIGGGATGVELASELQFYLQDLASGSKAKGHIIQVDLIEAAPRLLGLLSPKASKFAQWRLEELGVNLRQDTGQSDRGR